jgi:hypothetical protein
MAIVEDISKMFNVREAAVAATWYPSDTRAPVNTNVIFDSPSEIIFTGEQQSNAYQMYYDASAIAPTHGERVTVNGLDYLIVQPRTIGDGKIGLADLAKIS